MCMHALHACMHACMHTFASPSGNPKNPTQRTEDIQDMRVKMGKNMMMKLEDIREVPAGGPSHWRGATKCTVKIR